MHYVRIWSSILDGSLADDYDARHVYEDLLKLADADGNVDMHPNAIAARTRAPLSTLLPALERLEAPDPDSRSPEEEGRRIVRLKGRAWGWRIVNWHMYRNLRSQEVLRNQTRERVNRHRERARGAAQPTTAPVTQCNAVTLAVTPGSRKEEIGNKDSPPHPPKRGDLAPLGHRSAEKVVVLIPVRVKARSNEILEEPIGGEAVTELEREYPNVLVREELLEVRRWCLAQAERPRRGRLWVSAMPGIHNWLRKASREARAGSARASPASSAANHRASVDRAYLDANAEGSK